MKIKLGKSGNIEEAGFPVPALPEKKPEVTDESFSMNAVMENLIKLFTDLEDCTVSVGTLEILRGELNSYFNQNSPFVTAYKIYGLPDACENRSWQAGKEDLFQSETLAFNEIDRLNKRKPECDLSPREVTDIQDLFSKLRDIGSLPAPKKNWSLYC